MTSNEASATTTDNSAVREMLLDAALRVVARDGIDGLTYRSVGKEAGTAHGLVFYYFKSRENLIHEVAQRANARAIASIEMVPRGDDPADLVHDLPNAVERELETHMFLYELTVQVRRRDGVRDELRKLYDRYEQLIEDALAKMGVHPTPALARMVFATIDGLTLQQIISKDEERVSEALAELHAILRLLRDRGA